MKNKIVIITIIIFITIIGYVFLIKKNNDIQNQIANETNANEQDSVTEENKVILAEYAEEQSNGCKINKSGKIKEIHNIENFKITNIRITAKEQVTTILMDVQNTSTNTQKEKDVTMVMKDKNGESLGKIGLHLNQIEGKAARTVQIDVEYELINTYSIEIIEKELAIDN